MDSKIFVDRVARVSAMLFTTIRCFSVLVTFQTPSSYQNTE